MHVNNMRSYVRNFQLWLLLPVFIGSTGYQAKSPRAKLPLIEGVFLSSTSLWPMLVQSEEKLRFYFRLSSFVFSNNLNIEMKNYCDDWTIKKNLDSNRSVFQPGAQSIHGFKYCVTDPTLIRSLKKECKDDNKSALCTLQYHYRKKKV